MTNLKTEEVAILLKEKEEAKERKADQEDFIASKCGSTPDSELEQIVSSDPLMNNNRARQEAIATLGIKEWTKRALKRAENNPESVKEHAKFMAEWLNTPYKREETEPTIADEMDDTSEEDNAQ